MDFIMPISEVRGRLPELIRKIGHVGKPLVITRNGKPAAILLSLEDLETLEIKADIKVSESIVRAEDDLQYGNLYPHEVLFKDVS